MAKKKEVLEALVRDVTSLSKEDFETVMASIANANPHPESLSYVTNKFQKCRKGNRIPSSTDPKLTFQSDEVKLHEPGPSPKLKTGREGTSRALERSHKASLVPDLHGISAWKVPLLFRGDLVPKKGKVFIDVEKLSMKIGWVQVGRKKPKHTMVANNIAVVDEKGVLIFWAFIWRDINEICQYFTCLHRINKTKLLSGVPLETVRAILEKCFEGNTVVGAKVLDDLRSMSSKEEFENEKHFTHRDIIDLQDFYNDGNQAYKLKDVCAFHFPDKVRDYQTEFHSSISDARMTMQIYLEMCKLKAENSSLTNSSELGITRIKPKKMRFDKCRCN